MKKQLRLIPQPKKVSLSTGFTAMPRQGMIGIQDPSLYPVAAELLTQLPDCRICSFSPVLPCAVTIQTDKTLRHEEYRLVTDANGTGIKGGSSAACMHAVHTLAQILRVHPRERIPCVNIHDWPDFENRGIYYDVTRGRVPKLASLLEMVDTLASFKINQLQFYVEHVFKFRRYPDIWRRSSPLTPDDIIAVDARCRARNIEFVPSFASFGHMGNILRLPRYRHMAENWGVGRYVDPAAEKLAGWQRVPGASISPANPETYKFLDSLFAEFLPLFSSRTFNVCCDENFDLGYGQSFDLCRRKGKGRVYLDHILRLRDLAGKYGKKIMFWGDIIRHYPDLIPDIPGDITVLDWGYSSNHPFERIRDFRRARVPFYACPGTSSWVSLFPRLPEAESNIHGFAKAALRERANGLLTTDWGDGGHYNFMEYSWHGYLAGAEQAWNVGADRKSFTDRFASLFLGSDDPSLPSAISLLGDESSLSFDGHYQSIWQHLFFAPADHPLFKGPRQMAQQWRRGRLISRKVTLNAAFARKVLRNVEKVKQVLSSTDAKDPHGVLPYWRFAVDTIAHAARKLSVLAPDGRDTASARRGLAVEMHSLMRRFERLWRDSNRPSEIRTTLARYRKAITSLR